MITSAVKINTISLQAGLTVVLNDKLLESKGHYSPYKNDRILMLPVEETARTMGLKVKSALEDGYTMIYRETIYEKRCMIIRLFRRDDADFRNTAEADYKAFYYNYKRMNLPIDKAPEVRDGVLYAPSGFFMLAMKLEIEVQDDTVSLRYTPPPKEERE